MSVYLSLGVLATMVLGAPVVNDQGVAPPVTIIEVPFTTPSDWAPDTDHSTSQEPVSNSPDPEAPVVTLPVRSVQESGVSGSAGLSEGNGAAIVDAFVDDGLSTESNEAVEAPPAEGSEGSQTPSMEASQMPEAAPLPVGSGPWVLGVVAGAMTGLVLLLSFRTWFVVRYDDQGSEIRAPGPRSGAYFIGRFDDQRSDEVAPEQEDWVS